MRNSANSGRLSGMQESQQQRARVSNVNEPDGTVDDPASARETEVKATKPREIGGPKGVEPTRFGDWERAGRCIDF